VCVPVTASLESYAPADVALPSPQLILIVVASVHDGDVSTSPENATPTRALTSNGGCAIAGTAIIASARTAPTSTVAKRRKQRLNTLMKCTPNGVPGCPNVPLAGPERAATLHEE
jgi:hypothetical protein